MSRIKKTSPKLNLTRFQTFLVDNKENSEYFKLSEFPDELTSGKNGFLIEGSQYLKPTTEIKIEVTDTDGNPLYVEPGEGVPKYYEGLSKLVSIHVYENTPIGIGKITILGELETYIDENGVVRNIPDEWSGIYNIKWEKDLKINKNLLNETRVRFVKRPQILIEELGESFYDKIITKSTQNSGTIQGIAVQPPAGTNLNNYAGGITYYLKNESIPFADGAKEISIEGTQIQSASIVEYINQYTLAVRVPHTSSNRIVSDFTNKNYSLNYEYVSNTTESSVFGSFARFEINNLKTFVGDVERIKVFAKSNSSVEDFNLLYDARVNSSNLLETIISGSIIQRGNFSASYGDSRTWNTYWATESLNGLSNISLDSDNLYKSVKFRNYKIKTNVGNDIRLEKGSEYTIELNVLYNTPTQNYNPNKNDLLKIYAASSQKNTGLTSIYVLTSSLDTLVANNTLKTPTKLFYNFIPELTDDWNINFEAINDDSNTFWQIGGIKIYGSNELGYSPDEFAFIVPLQRTLEQENFDFRLEYFDLNNNFVPIQNITSQTFVSGNLSLLGKNIDVSSDKIFFSFDGNESPTPSDQVITISANKTKILGSLLISSEAFDSGGAYIPPVSFGANPYPGNLSSKYETSTLFSASLSIADFTGSLYGAPPTFGNINVDRILYTFSDSSIQPVVKKISIGRILQGTGSAGAAGSDAKTVNLTTNIFTIPYDGDGIEIGTNNIFLTASQQNHVGTIYYEFLKNGVSKQNTTSEYYTVLSVDEPTTSSVDLWRVNTREGSSGGTVIAFDSINLFGVKAGSDSYTIVLSNESHTLPTTNTGIVNYTGSGTDIQVYKGADELSGILSGTPTLGQFSASYNVTNGSISVGAVSLSGNKIRFNSHSAMGTDSSTIAYVIYLEGLNTNFVKVQSLAKSFEGNDGANGSDGTDAKVISLSSDKYTFTYNGDNVRTPLAQTASLTGSAQNIAIPYYQFYKNNILKSPANYTSPYWIITGSEIPSAGTRDLWEVRVWDGIPAGGALAFDNIDIFGLKDGGDAKTVDLASPNYIIVYDKNGQNPTPSLLFPVTASARNFASPLFKFTGDIDSPEISYTVGSSSNADTASFTPPSSFFTTPKQLRVGVSENSNPTVEVAFDTITIAAVRPGLDGISGSSSTFYYIKPLNGTQIKNSQGTLEIQAIKVSGSTSFNLNSGSVVLTTGSSANSVLQSGNGVTAGSNGVSFNAILNSSAINGSRTIILKDTGSNEVYDTATLIDVTDGVSAGSGIADTLVFRREINNTYTPATASLTASFFSTNGLEYQERYKVYAYFNGIQDQMYATLEADSPYITSSIDNGDGTKIGLQFTNRTTTKDLNFTFEFRDPQINETSSFTETMYIVSDGIDGDDGYTVQLTNDNHSVPVSNDNPPVFDYAGSGTQIIAYRGAAQLNSTTSTPTSGTFSASFAVTNGNITVGAFDVSGFPIVIGDHSNLTTNAATITYTVNLEGSASLTRVQSINRATEGDDGFSVYLTNDSDTYPADQDGIVQRLNILGLYTEVNVFKGTTQYVYNQLGGANTYKTGSIVSSSNITISQSIVNNNVRITPTSATGSTQITGSVLIPIVTGSLTFNRTYTFGISKAGTSGSNALSIVLSPTNQTVSKSQAGSYGRPVTFSLQVFETGSPLLYTGSNNTLQSGYFTIFAPSAAGTLVPATGSISASIVPPLVISDSGVTSSFSVVYRDSKGNLSSYISQSHRVAVVSDGINGASGSDSKTISLFSDRYTFTYDQNGILTPLNSQTASLTASAQTGSVNWGANIYYQFQKNGTTVSPANWSTPFWIVTSSVGASSIPSAGGIDIWQVNLLSGSGQVFVASDSTDLFGLKSGSDAYTVFLTNESHVFSANELGVVPSSEYSGGATQVRFFRGTTQYTYDQVAPYNTNSYRTGSAIYSFNITASSATVNNDLQLTPIAVTGSTGQLSGSIVLPIIDNATNVTFSKTYTFSISKAGSSGSNALSILLNPTNQVVTKSQAGTYQRPVTFSIQVFETGSPLLYTGSNNTLQSGYFTIYAQTANAMGTLIPATASISASIIPPIVTTDSGTTSSFALQYRDSKGTLSNWISQSHRINVVTDGRDGVSGSNAIDWWMAPNTQTVTASLALGTYSTASRFNVYVFETGSPMRYTTSDPPTTRGTWTIVMSTIGSNGTNNSTNNEISGTVTPPLPTAIRPFTSSFQLRYLDSKGNLSNYISQSHVINVVSVGQTGPGIVFTGPWTSGRTYQYSEGSSNGRRDAVISGSSNRYYATLQQHISDGTNFPTDGSSNAFWQFLGNEDFFVAAKIAIFEESYVQNTLNIGTTNYEAGFSSANITLAGGTQYPFISIGQTAANYNNPGIWIGNRTGSFVASFQSTGGSFLKWDGSQLFISGNISASIGRIGGITISSQSLFIGEGGYDNTNTGFFVSSSGDFSLKNSVVWNNSAGTFDIRNGSLNLAGGTGTSTNINNSGLLNAQNAIIGGTITATNGNIGGWSISDNFLQAGSTSVGTIKLDKSRPAISLFSGSQTSPAVEITTVGEFSNTGSLSIGLTGSDSTKATSVSITTAELEGSSNNNTGGDISSQYTGLSISYSSGSTSRLEGSAIATFTIDQGLNNKTVTLNFGNIGYNNGVNTGSIFAEVDSNHYISNASFNMRYGFALYSSSTSGDVFIDSVSKSGTGQNTLSNSNRAVRSGINYSGTLSLIKTLKKGDYKIKPFVDLISVNIDSTEIVGGGGCNCPSNGTFAYYGECDPVSGQEVYRYDGTCDGFGNCNVVLTYENSNCY